MNSPTWWEVEHQQLLAKIVLLHLLNDTPIPPSGYSIHDSIATNKPFSPRVLSLKREKELAESLAFLAGNTDDPKKVVALCIEEEQDGKGMTIRLAVNNGGLEDVQNGFRGSADILQSISKKEGVLESSEKDLLKEVVTLNRNRILCRLRSKHASLRCNFKKSKMGRPKVLSLLMNAFSEIHGNITHCLSPGAAADLRYTVKTLYTLFERLENLTKAEALSRAGLDILLVIVVVARRLYSLDTLGLVLDSSAFGSETKSLIARTVMKLGRYSTASNFLCRAAKEFPIFAKIQISVIKLPAPLMKSIYEPDNYLAGMARSLFDAAEIGNATSRLEARLKKKHVEYAELCTTISSTKFIVHAEIQLLVYYELTNCSFPPRVICSSKKACFLCNLFIRLHGKFIIPSTHGRLYEKWTLPESLKELRGDRAEVLWSTIAQFSDALKNRLRQEIFAAEKPFPAPQESIVFESAIWSAPLQSNSSLESASATACDCEQEKPPSLVQKTDKLSRKKNSPYLPLPRGETLSFELSLYGELLKVGTPQIHLALSYEVWKRSITSLQDLNKSKVDKGCRVNLKWLQASEVPVGDWTIVDLDNFPEGSEANMDQFAGKCNFYVCRGRETISVRTLYL